MSLKEEEMAGDRKLFAVTQWVLRAGIIGTMLVIAWAVTIFGLMASGVPLDKIATIYGLIGFRLPLIPHSITADEFGAVLANYAEAIAAVALIHFIFRALRRVVASASDGDPFIEANAADLVRVAWLFLGVNVINALKAPTLYLLAPPAMRAKLHGMVHISITGLFAVLLIFVLAQIFRRGSNMRAELAETV
jgi:hypothetical protein